jgi:sarcosine oxidase subunit beta
MYSARGVLNLVHTPADMDAAMRRGNAMRLNGIDAQFLSRDEIAARIPNLDCSPDARFPILGGLLQRRGGTVRHDAVAWGYARAADALGVDILQQCEVTGIRVERGAVTGVRTTRGDIGTSKIGIAVAGHSSQVAAMAGIRLPIESHVLQAMVSEPVKPVLDTVTSALPFLSASPTRASSSWGRPDFYNSYASAATCRVESRCSVHGALPSFGRLRRCARGGIMDMTMDGLIIGKLPVKGRYDRRLVPSGGRWRRPRRASCMRGRSRTATARSCPLRWAVCRRTCARRKAQSVPGPLTMQSAVRRRCC